MFKFKKTTIFFFQFTTNLGFNKLLDTYFFNKIEYTNEEELRDKLRSIIQDQLQKIDKERGGNNGTSRTNLSILTKIT